MGYPDESYYHTRWVTGIWSAQAKVEAIVPIAARNWCSDNSTVNDSLGKPGGSPLYVGLPSAWGSVEGDRIFSPIFVGGLLNWEL